ncbi:MAG TPA: hypothetical protein VFD43_10350, partial [Planctomycetota bacterium]|nr:hypothetical protein [Planctomycetota bacterium]
MIEHTARPLTPAERRALGIAAAALRKRLGQVPARAFGVAGAIGAILCALTLLAADEPWYVVVPIWLGLSLALAVWVLVDGRKGFRKSLGRLESALARNEARVVRIAAEQMVELEEVEDEGACYAFQVEPERMMFVTGQAFYRSGRFPNSDFSIATVLDESGREVELFIEKRGEPLKPVRRIPAEVKARLRQPGHLELLA